MSESHPPPPGWYPKPNGAFRWWDGAQFTDDVPPQPVDSAAPPTISEPTRPSPSFTPTERREPVEHPDGPTILVLGVVSILLPLLFPAPLLRGWRVLHQMDENPGRYSNRGVVQAGTVLGGIGGLLLLLAPLLLLS